MSSSVDPRPSKSSFSRGAVGRGRFQRHVRVRGEVRDEPDVERIAQSIIDLTLYLAESGLTLEEHQARMQQHVRLEASLRHRGGTVGMGPLPGCMCRDCEKRAKNRS